MDQSEEQPNQENPQQPEPVVEETQVQDNSAEVTEQINGTNDLVLQIDSDEVPVEFVANYNVIKSASEDSVPKSKLSEEKVRDQLVQLFTGCCEIYSYAHEYDFKEVKFNGFRSYLRKVYEYLDQLSLIVRLLKSEIASKKTSKLVKRINKYIDVLPLLLVELNCLRLIRKQKFLDENCKLDESNGTDIVKTKQVNDKTLPLELEVLINLMKITEKDMEAFYNETVSAFWLPSSVRSFIRQMEKIIIPLVFYRGTQGLIAFFSKKKLAALSADRAVNSSAADVEKHNKFLKRVVFSKVSSDVTVSEHKLSDRQGRWIMDRDSATLLEQVIPSTEYKVSPVRLVIIKPKVKKTDTVIFHIHGGGWSILSPESYFKVTNKWAKEIGATVVSIDYLLAPKYKYPIALQEILDTYLWLAEAAAKGETLQPLGFAPKDIVVQGDSAGGNLTVALAILLAEIKKKSGESPKLPKALLPQYPAASPGLPYISASSVLLDVALNYTVRARCCSTYYCEDPCENVSYLNGKNEAWFKDEDKLKEVYTRVNGHKKGDPIFHITTYDSFDLLKEVPIYIQAAEFDPLLDDAVAIAKLWKGPVTLDVVPNVVHGFSLFAEKSTECLKADQLVTRRLKEAVEASV